MSNTESPRAPFRPVTTELHGETRVDGYGYLKDREDPETIPYLEAENAHVEAAMQDTKALQESLFEEFLSRIQEDDQGVPYRHGDYLYYDRTEKGKSYSIYCRKGLEEGAKEEIILDVNKLAEGHEYTSVGAVALSPNHRYLAYGVDHAGDELYQVVVKDLTTGEHLPGNIENAYYGLEWGNDNATIFFTRVDEAHRPDRLFRTSLDDLSKETIVLEEPDDRFFLSLGKSQSEEYIFVSLDSAITSEVHVIEAAAPMQAPKLFAPRKDGVEYNVSHWNENFLILTNEDAQNFKLMETKRDAWAPENWRELIAQSDDTLQAVIPFKSFLAVYRRHNGLPEIVLYEPSSDGLVPHVIQVSDATWDIWPSANAMYDTDVFRYGYTSMTTPTSTLEITLSTKESTLLKQRPAPGYNPELYTSSRVWAETKDGTKVPVSVFHKKGRTEQPGPFLLYGYGSYGASYDVAYNSRWLSLLDRGFAVGIAHIRGGGEFGRGWKLNGKFEHKINSFTDFIACAETLIQGNWTKPELLAVEGRSAGGLLMGGIMNMRPDLFGAVIAGVPFVDVINTLLDETIPLTVIEWDEWGNPQKSDEYQWIRPYSPYDNITAQPYPNALFLGGLNDPRVGYWEPAKFVAKLRQNRTNQNYLFLKTDMGSGHGGASGRYGQLRDDAFEFAFVLKALGLADTSN